MWYELDMVMDVSIIIIKFKATVTVNRGKQPGSTQT